VKALLCFPVEIPLRPDVSECCLYPFIMGSSYRVPPSYHRILDGMNSKISRRWFDQAKSAVINSRLDPSAWLHSQATSDLIHHGL
jgi:hypothetical protein